jgi:hypothetical protein
LHVLLSRQELKISKLELAHLRLRFALEHQLEVEGLEKQVIEFIINEPDYTKGNEIAGFYGAVSLDDLKKGFQDYFPIFQKEETPVASIVEPKEEPMNIDEIPLLAGEVDHLDTLNMPEEIVETAVASKKPRLSKPKNFSKHETDQALMYMYKDQVKSLKTEE